MPPYRFTCLIAASLLLACSRAPAPAPVATAASAPETAVLALATHLKDNDLDGYARAAVPPDEYRRLEAAWRAQRSRWPLSELPLEDQLAPLLATLSAPGAERSLQQGYRRNFANQHKDLKQAARSLGLFGVQYVKREGAYTEQERSTYAQVIEALSEWAVQAPLGDPGRSAPAITTLTAAARNTGLANDAAWAEAGMAETLQRLGPFFAAAKSVLADYGLPLDDSYASLRTEMVEQTGDRATVRLRYPLGEREIDTVIALQRRDGKWYRQDTLRRVEAILADAESAADPEELLADAPADEVNIKPAIEPAR